MGTMVKLAGKEIEVNGSIRGFSITRYIYNEDGNLCQTDTRYPGITYASKIVNTYDYNGNITEITSCMYDDTKKKKMHKPTAAEDNNKFVTKLYYNKDGLVEKIDNELEKSTTKFTYYSNHDVKSKEIVHHETNMRLYYEFYKNHGLKKSYEDTIVNGANMYKEYESSRTKNSMIVEEAMYTYGETGIKDLAMTKTSEYSIHGKNMNLIYSKLVNYRKNNEVITTKFTEEPVGPHRKYVITSMKENKYNLVTIFNDFANDDLCRKINYRYKKGFLESATAIENGKEVTIFTNEMVDGMIIHRENNTISIGKEFEKVKFSLDIFEGNYTMKIFDNDKNEIYSKSEILETGAYEEDILYKNDKRAYHINTLYINKNRISISNMFNVSFSTLGENERSEEDIDIKSNSNEVYTFIYSMAESDIPEFDKIMELKDKLLKEYQI
jgi:hypothetical protein